MPLPHRPGMLEVWDLVAHGSAERPSVWVRHVMSTPRRGAGTRSGWVCVFHPTEGPRTVRFTPVVADAPLGGEPESGDVCFSTGDVRLSPNGGVGRVGGVVWELETKSVAEPIWVTPRVFWSRPIGIAAEVVTPLVELEGEIRVEGNRVELSGLTGSLSHRRSRGHPRLWARAFAELGKDEYLAVSAVVPGSRILGRNARPVVFLRWQRRTGEPVVRVPAGALRFSRRGGAWRVHGPVGARELIDVRVGAPEVHPCENVLGDPSGGCFYSEVTCRASAEVRLMRHREGPLWVVERSWRARGGVMSETSERGKPSPADVADLAAA
ncbi:MAG: hypothetical protein KatS3mg008_0806 [Acidimicrobiales bacterium]|nr:MAG: hypothetical protein KatS3mg008_0806 [Acidimicrobiales bacterium]